MSITPTFKLDNFVTIVSPTGTQGDKTHTPLPEPEGIRVVLHYFSKQIRLLPCKNTIDEIKSSRRKNVQGSSNNIPLRNKKDSSRDMFKRKHSEHNKSKSSHTSTSVYWNPPHANHKEGQPAKYWMWGEVQPCFGFSYFKVR